MRAVSWNVNGIRACVRHGFVDFVDRSGADIVGVQDVRARPEDIPPAARRPPGWHTAFTVAERRGYSGVGIYSKLRPVRVETSLGVPRFDREGRFMAAHFQPGFPISPWYRTHRINRRVLSLQGSDARSRTTEGDTWWVKKKPVRFSSHSTAC